MAKKATTKTATTTKAAKPAVELIEFDGADEVYAAILAARNIANDEGDKAAVAALTRAANARAKFAGRAGKKTEKAKAALQKRLAALDAAAKAAGVTLTDLLPKS